MTKKTTIALATILTFVSLRYMHYFLGYCIFGKDTWNAMNPDLQISILLYSQIVIALVVTAVLFKKIPFEFVGLKKDVLRGFAIAFLCTLPMFIGYGYKAGFHTDINLLGVHKDMMLAGFFEEFMFRGFIFGILFFYCGWGFIPAVFIPSFFFGIGHLYQAEHLSDGIQIFLFTSLGGAGFAWIFVMWRSLWMVLFLHGFMDLAWDMFDIQTNVMGSLYANIFRFTTLGLAVYLSAREGKRNNRYAMAGKWWVNKEEI